MMDERSDIDSWYAAKMTVYNCPVCRPMAEL